MIFLGLDYSFGKVAAVIVCRHELKRHVGGLNFGTIENQDFVVEDLVFWFDALVFHACEGTTTCQNHLHLHFVLYRLHPSGVAVNVIE